MKRTYTYSTKDALKDFDLEIKVSKYFEFYYSGSDLPQELADSVINHTIIISKQNKFSNIKDLDAHVNSIIEKFETQFIEQSRRNVIIYSVNFEARNDNKKSWHSILKKLWPWLKRELASKPTQDISRKDCTLDHMMESRLQCWMK